MPELKLTKIKSKIDSLPAEYDDAKEMFYELCDPPRTAAMNDTGYTESLSSPPAEPDPIITLPEPTHKKPPLRRSSSLQSIPTPQEMEDLQQFLKLMSLQGATNADEGPLELIDL